MKQIVIKKTQGTPCDHCSQETDTCKKLIMADGKHICVDESKNPHEWVWTLAIILGGVQTSLLIGFLQDEIEPKYAFTPLIMFLVFITCKGIGIGLIKLFSSFIKALENRQTW